MVKEQAKVSRTADAYDDPVSSNDFTPVTSRRAVETRGLLSVVTESMQEETVDITRNRQEHLLD